MGISQWKFEKAGTSEFRDRYLLKLTGSREDISALYKKHASYMWIPFLLTGDAFTWGIYFDGISDEEIESIKEHLGSITKPEIKLHSTSSDKKADATKIEIIGSTWDWQQMQMKQGGISPAQEDLKETQRTPPPLPPETKPPEQHEKELPEPREEEIPEQHEKKSPPVFHESLLTGKTSPVPDKKEKKAEKNDVEVTEIISELNKILADFTAKEDAGPSLKGGFSSEEISASSPGFQKFPQFQKEEQEEKESSVKPVSTGGSDKADEKDDSAWDELSNMIEDSAAEKTVPQIQQEPGPVSEEPVPVSEEPVPVFEEPYSEPQKIPVPAIDPVEEDNNNSDPRIMTLAVIISADDTQTEKVFLKNISENVAKVSKGALSVQIVLVLPIDGNAFDPQETFKSIVESNAEMVFFVGQEKSSPYKMGQLRSFLEDKNIVKKSISKSQIDKQFVYLDCAVEVMITKKKINSQRQ